MHITDPVTMLTDYALGIQNLFFAISIYSSIHSGKKVTGLLLMLGFLAEALSGFAGGSFHGFAAALNTAWRQSLWNLTLLSIGATIAFLASAIHAADVHRENGQWIVAGVVIGVAGLAVQFTGFRAHQVWNHNDFFHVIQMVAMYLFFRGARRLKDRPYSPR
jgi:Family of unknown function (DUF6962)